MTTDQLEASIWQALTLYERQAFHPSQPRSWRGGREHALAADILVQSLVGLAREFERSGERAAP